MAGLASGLLGVGGGVIVTPLLALLTPFSQATVLGTSLLSMIPPASAALVQHSRCDLGEGVWFQAGTRGRQAACLHCCKHCSPQQRSQQTLLSPVLH